MKLQTCKTCASTEFTEIPNGVKCDYCGNEYHFPEPEFKYIPPYNLTMMTCLTAFPNQKEYYNEKGKIIKVIKM